MTRIDIIKENDGYAYKYCMLNEENKPFYVKKSGFKTPEEALEMAKISYDRRIAYAEKHWKINKRKPLFTKHQKEVLSQAKEDILLDLKEFGLKNLEIRDGGVKILKTATIGVVIVVVGIAGARLIKNAKDKFAATEDTKIEEVYNPVKEVIYPKDCDFNNLHIVLRTAQNNTHGVSLVTSAMLDKLGVSNEIISKGTKLSKTIKYNQKNVVVINLESGFETGKTDNTIIMGDSSNNRKYSSDILAACIKASLKEYNLSPYIRSGKKNNLWRKETSVEEELSKAKLSNKVSQLTIDLPIKVGTDDLIRNDAAASIVEGIMRWATIDPAERYENIYYTAEYGDSLVSVAQDYDISLDYIRKYSDVNMNKGVVVGNTILVSQLPKAATDSIVVNNPCVTTDLSAVKQKLNKYIVQQGDTITKIANTHGVKVDDIVIPGNNKDKIKAGDTIYIRTYSKYETHRKGQVEKELQK